MVTNYKPQNWDIGEYGAAETSRVETMMFVGETPWHGIGTQVTEALTAKEALVAAELDWDVVKAPVFTMNQAFGSAVEPVEVKGWNAIQRKTDGRTYTVAKDGYTPMQNMECFNFFDGVIGEGKAVYEVAGSLYLGAKVWIVARLRDSIDVNGDEVKPYLTLVNSHDGSTALQMFWAPLRVVCRNTLRMAVSQASERFYARHTKGINNRVADAREILGMANAGFAEFKEVAEWMGTRQITSQQRQELVATAAGYYKPGDDLDKVLGTIGTKGRNELGRIDGAIDSQVNGPVGQYLGSYYHAYNGITWYVDWAKNFRYSENTHESREYARVAGAMLGGGRDMKQRAWSYLTAQTN